jgi:SfnB family sulfur acquisition oxidoreductase
MGTVSQLHERARPPAHLIQSDDEALEAARSLAADFARLASDRDINRILPDDELEALSQSGLLGVSVPSEYEGLDISNAILAEIIAILAQGDPSIAEISQSHFHVLEILRLADNEEEKQIAFARALAGDRMAGAFSALTAIGQETRLTADGAGYRLGGRQAHSTGILFADWIAVFARDPANEQVLSLLPRRSEGVQLIDDWDGFGQRTNGGGTTILHNVYVDAEAVIRLDIGLKQPTTIGAVGRITRAGVDLGIARAAFAATVDFVRSNAQPRMDGGIRHAADNPLTIARIGEIAVRIEAAAAMIERAGGKLDIAQINATEEHVIDAALSVVGASALAAEIAIEASTALFELAGTSSTRIGLNLDRHWRNARAHAAREPTSQKHHTVGNYHLNDIAPPKNEVP